MRITIEEFDSYDGPEWRWKVVSGGNVGFVMKGKCPSYRCACRHAKKAYKKLDGIGYLPYEGNPECKKVL